MFSWLRLTFTHAIINSRRFSSASPRRYARSARSPIIRAREDPSSTIIDDSALLLDVSKLKVNGRHCINAVSLRTAARYISGYCNRIHHLNASLG
jgi:hypothetical protein